MKSPLKILILHNAYQQAGGEDGVVAAEAQLLRAAGQEVRVEIVHNDSIRSISSKIDRFFKTPYDRDRVAWMQTLLADAKPDIVHVHNFFPLLTPAIYDACQAANTPVVQTLHNYRTICSSALLMRQNAICEKCVTGSPFWGAWHRCYRGSMPGSFAVSRMIHMHRKRGTWHSKVDRFIALTNFAKQKFVEGGFPANKIIVKPNFCADLPVENTKERHGALFVGRISPEKGIDLLANAWDDLDYPLRVVGDGAPHLGQTLQGHINIKCLGRLQQDDVAKEMYRSSFLLFPSINYEGFPLTLVEAFSRGLPVIASRLGGMGEIVEDNVTGLLFAPGDVQDFREKVSWARAHPEEMLNMGRNARQVFEEKYTGQENYRQLMSIYSELLNKAHV